MAKDTPKKATASPTGGMTAAMLPPGQTTGRRGPLPAPTPSPQGLGGLDLSALATQAQGETQTRVAGQGSLIDAYLDQQLGMATAKNAAAGERDARGNDFDRERETRMQGFQRQRAVMDEALQRARIEQAALEGMKDRDMRSVLSAEDRAFELGQAATQRDRQALEDQMLQLQIQQMEQELGETEAPGQFGQYDVSADRGSQLSRGRQNDLRGTTFQERTGEGMWGFLPGKQGQMSPVTYDDLAQDAQGYVDEFGEDPNEVTRRIRELARNRPQLASLLLYDIGYNPAAFLAE